MADISSKLDKIKSAERGEDVRDAIIGALRDINNDVPADMSNPERITADMPGSSDLTIPFNPPKLVSEIYVRQAGSGGKSTTLKDITITENGEYPTDEEDYDASTENRYYKKVKVDVPQLANKIEMDEVVIEQNGTYSAIEWGVDGLRNITVNVQAASGDGPFQVDFYDKPASDPTAAVIESQLVAKFGSVEFQGIKPTSPLGTFAGWSPSPTNVTRDLKCYPNFAQIIVDPTEIQDDWAVICANGGAPYPLGAHKILAYGASIPGSTMRNYISGWDPDTNYDISVIMMMYKVCEGEGNSHSSWLGTPIFFHDFGIDAQNWDVCNLRNFLNGAFFDNMADIFKSSIVPVIKYSVTTPNRQDLIPTGSQDKVWVPNYSEIISYQTGLDETGVYDWINSNTWPAPERYPTSYLRATLTDTTSMKYIRDYLNNDRNFIFALAKNWDGSIINNAMIYIRDIRNVVKDTQSGYTLQNIGGGSYIANENSVPWFRVSHINIGFCL